MITKTLSGFWSVCRIAAIDPHIGTRTVNSYSTLHPHMAPMNVFLGFFVFFNCLNAPCFLRLVVCKSHEMLFQAKGNPKTPKKNYFTQLELAHEWINSIISKLIYKCLAYGSPGHMLNLPAIYTFRERTTARNITEIHSNSW